MTNSRHEDPQRLGDIPLVQWLAAPGPAMTTSSPAGSDTPPGKFKRGVPIERAGDTFESFDLTRNRSMKRAYDRCWELSLGRAWCAMLAGRTGNGKTHLAVATMNVFGWDRSHFYKVPNLLDLIKRLAFDENWRIEDITRSWRESPALMVLDDLGVENPTDWAHEQLYRVLDERYDRRLPTIITTNATQERLDERILSRYAEGLVVCNGDDLRRVK